MGRPQTLKDTNTFYWERNKVGHPTKVYKRYFKGNQQQYDTMSPAMKQKYLTPSQSKDLYNRYTEIEENRTLKSVIADENLPARSNPTTSWEMYGVINRSDFDPDDAHEIDTTTAKKTYLGKLKKPTSFKVPINKKTPTKRASTPKKKSSSGKIGRPKKEDTVKNLLEKRYPEVKDRDKFGIPKTTTIEGVTYHTHIVKSDKKEPTRNALRKHYKDIKAQNVQKLNKKAPKGYHVILYATKK